ncbi:MAG: helix-turn-helix transcriptional regulator [Candidatus Izimaplasma sp.]|nr:helix-turn-helix transcriptional regulator [Candidatus Izimaplasma bacterium]
MSKLPGKLTNNIKQLRAKLDLTQEELAIKTKCSRQTISAIEKNRYSPSLLLAYKISHILESEIDDVFSTE